MSAFKDLTGIRFGKLTAIKPNGKTKQNMVLWLCKCDCGNEVTVRGTNLSQKRTKSCGCSRLEEIKKRREMNSWDI